MHHYLHFLTRWLTVGILLSTEVRAAVVAKLLISGILSTMFLMLSLHISFLTTSFFTTSAWTGNNLSTSNLSTLLYKLLN